MGEQTRSAAEVVEPRPGGVSGLVRRVRRILQVSQRGLAERLGVSQSVVARWETGRTSPVADELVIMLRMAGLRMLVTLAADEPVDVGARAHAAGPPAVVEPMRADGARDRGGRRFPAHSDIYATEWWGGPLGSTHVSHLVTRRRSQEREDPDIRYRLGWRREVHRSVFGTPADHPSRAELVAGLHRIDAERHRHLGGWWARAG